MNKNILIKLLLVLLLINTSIFAKEVTFKALDILQKSTQNLDLKKLNSGEIITLAREDQEVTDTSIALSMALYVKAPYKKVLKDIKKSGNVLSSYSNAKLIKVEDTKNLKPYIQKIEFAKNEKDEVEKLFDFDGGDKFNLSKREIQRWKELTKDKKVDIKIASTFYQDVLKNRLEQYITKGIKGIESYNHLDADTTTVKGMEKSSQFLNSFKELLPDLYKDYMNYPTVEAKDTKQNFYIIKDKLESRPTFILKHQMTQEKNNMFVVAERQFYISHDLDAIQTQIICLPYKEGTIIALSSQSFTPKVSGFARNMAVEIGRKMMGKEILPMLEKIQKKYNK